MTTSTAGLTVSSAIFYIFYVSLITFYICPYFERVRSCLKCDRIIIDHYNFLFYLLCSIKSCKLVPEACTLNILLFRIFYVSRKREYWALDRTIA